MSNTTDTNHDTTNHERNTMNSQPMQTTLQELEEAGKIVEYSIGSYSGMAEYMVWIDPTEPAGTVLRIQEEAGASRVIFHQA